MDLKIIEKVLAETSDVFYEMDVQKGVYTYMSPSVNKLLGSDPSHFIGNNLAVF